MVVGELLLSAFFQVLFDRLTNGELLNFATKQGVHSKLKKWDKTLKMIQAVLSDAEEKQLTDQSVQIWLEDLRDLAYDAEDVLDEFATEALKRKLMAEDPDYNLVPSCFTRLNPSSIEFSFRMRSKIKDISSRLEEVCRQRIELGLQLTPEGTSSASAHRRPPSSSVPTERILYGRDEDKAKVLEMVLSHEPSVGNYRVIPIVGMAGVGKTTLAREIYNDKNVQDFKFDLKAWVCVSDNFNVLSISRAILESITSAACDLKALNEVQVELKKSVDGKKILLILDDVWNEDYNSWEDLKAPFLVAAPNSKIIVTTRHSHVALTMGPIQHYNLQRLSDEDCWSVFMKHAFEGRDVNAHQISELYRKKIDAKCGGLPLVAKTLGGLLRSKRDEEWGNVLESKIWDLEESGILPVLRLSYHHLPSHLKRCFAYCAIFPKDYEFKEKETVFLWMAEGIIQQSTNHTHLEDWGSKCFHDLVSRSIFQQSSGDTSKFVMHDLVQDLAQFVSGKTISRLEDASKLSAGRLKKVRHSCYSRGEFDGKNKFKVLYEVENLRTFLPLLKRGGTDVSYITNMLLSELLPRFKKLRVLSLQGYYITQLPVSFTDLRLLSYLNFAGTRIRSLPESTCSLLHLQILILRDCICLMKLPSKLRNLINLRHLDIKGANLLKEMPLGVNELKYLQTLSNFIVGKGMVSTLEDLSNLKFLRGKLCISGLQNMNDARDAREASLFEKEYLEALLLQWGSQFDSSRDELAEENVLDMLQPNKNIKVLKIRYYGGVKFPLWIGDPLFCNMEVLKIENCENCRSLPSLGLLGSLKHLTIKGMSRLRIIGPEIYGRGFLNPFQSLETLHFENMLAWESWDTSINENEHPEAFPCLRELFIVGCFKLSGKLPDLLPSLETLVVSKCAELVVSFSNFPKLCRLEIDECKGLLCSTPVDSELMKSVTISNSLLQIYGCSGMVFNNCPADSRSIQRSLSISNFLELGKLLKQGFQNVETLAVGDSKWIELRNHHMFSPLRKHVQGLSILTHPDEISIEESCMCLVPFPEVNFLPNNLRSLEIVNSRALKSLPEEMMGNNAQIESLYISHCDSLTYIARCNLPSSLETLDIWYCQNLKQLVIEEEVNACSSLSSSLKYLRIYECPELITLSSGIRLLEALEYLYIIDCPKLESIPDGLHNTNCLQRLFVHNCPSLASFPEGGLPSTISCISIGGCEKLKSLPDNIHKLNSLQELEISECPSIISFPAEGVPINLKSLKIEDVKMYEALIEWGLHRLTSLRRLWIHECHNAKSFPDEEKRMMLPTSLTELIIWGSPKLKYLSSRGFQNLNSLEFLWIKKCPMLKSIPEFGLPSSLLQLHIDGCPLLKRDFKRDEGKEWSQISHIPRVAIDSKFIYDS